MGRYDISLLVPYPAKIPHPACAGFSCLANISCWPIARIPSADWNVGFIESPALVPDSGHLHVAVQ